MPRVFLLLVILGAFLTSGYWMGWSGVEQPIRFPHKTHLDLNLACTTCHFRAEKDAVAGRPPTALCFGCHMAGDTQSEEVKKIRAYGEKGQEIPWRRVWRLPEHVFFPHQAHVAAAGLKCQTCHGPMETLTRPPTRPLKTLTMDDCIGCHKARSAAQKNKPNEVRLATAAAQRLATDCIACHR
jgi:hypothetical protein